MCDFWCFKDSNFYLSKRFKAFVLDALCNFCVLILKCSENAKSPEK